ncbi:MAG: Lacal_2735 family protein [Saprospiraceae bacterium]|nr:Lacal_2735 family protein [Saprospiraceae bacterium]
MFGWLKKDPAKKLEKKYALLMEEAMTIQRSGDLKAYAVKIAEAEELLEEIERLKKDKQ